MWELRQLQGKSRLFGVREADGLQTNHRLVQRYMFQNNSERVLQRELQLPGRVSRIREHSILAGATKAIIRRIQSPNRIRIR